VHRRRAGREHEALEGLQTATRWLEQTAREQVASEFCDSFLQHKRFNRQLLAQASRPWA